MTVRKVPPRITGSGDKTTLKNHLRRISKLIEKHIAKRDAILFLLEDQEDYDLDLTVKKELRGQIVYFDYWILINRQHRLEVWRMLNDIPPARPITYPGNTDGIAVDSLFNLRLPADILRFIISNSVYSISTLTKLTSREGNVYTHMAVSTRMEK